MSKIIDRRRRYFGHTKGRIYRLLLANPSDPDLWATADGEVQSC